MKVGDFYGAWLGGGLGNAVGPLTTKTRRYMLSRAIDELGDVELTALRPVHLWRLQQSCLRDGLAVATVNLITHTALRALLRDAAGLSYVRADDVDLLYRAVRQVPGEHERTRAPMTRPERDRLLAEIRRRRAWGLPLAAWLFATGMRPGEAMGLLWEDVELEQRTCHIRRSRHETVVTTCKTANSRRTIPLAYAAVAALAGVKRRRGTDYVFTGARGTTALLVENYSRYIWRPSCVAVGLDGRVLYTTRHSFISWQISAGKTPAAVARYCGTSVKIILAHYYQYTDDFMREEWDDGLEAKPVTNVTPIRGRR